MCRYFNVRFIGCKHSRTVVLYRCDSNHNKTCPAPCFQRLIDGIHDEYINMPSKCPECDPNPSTELIPSPSARFSNAFRVLARDLILRGQWISYTEVHTAFRKLFHWDLPVLPTDRLFNEDEEASSQLTPLKRDMIKKFDQLGILTLFQPRAIHAPIWFG